MSVGSRPFSRDPKGMRVQEALPFGSRLNDGALARQFPAFTQIGDAHADCPFFCNMRT